MVKDRLVIAGYSHDIGPAKNVSLVMNAAIQAGHRVRFMGNIKIDHTDFISLVGIPNSSRDAFVTSLSSPENGSELAIGEYARKTGKPWILIADTHRGWARVEAIGRVENAILLTASPSEIDEAKAFGYKDVRYFAGPPLWQDFHKVLHIEISRLPGHKVVLVGGTTETDLTARLLDCTINALREINNDFQLIFKPHPNADPQDALKLIEGVLTQVKIIGTPYRTTEILGSVDVSVLVGGSTDHIAAAYMRVPSISYEDEKVSDELEKSATYGYRVWFPSEKGAVKKVTDDRDMVYALRELFTDNGKEELRRCQERVYPIIDPRGKDKAANKIVSLIESLV